MSTKRDQPVLQIFDVPHGWASDRVRPLITSSNRHHYDGLCRGHLLLPKCNSCGRTGRPAGAVCPWCLSSSREWVETSPDALVHSVVRYHRAYLPEFEHLVPYAVVAAQMAGGPVLYGRWLVTKVVPYIGQPILAAVEKWADGFGSLAFQERLS